MDRHILALVIFALVTCVTPGPNNVMLTATGANVGIRRGLPHVFGINVGFALMMFIVAAGIGTALVTHPSALQAMRYVGSAVLLWLAWKIGTATEVGGQRPDGPVGFWEAAAFQWVNPKAWLICAGAVSGFLRDGTASPLSQAAMFGLIFLVAGTPCSMTWLGFGAGLQHLLTTKRALRVFNIAMGLLLAATVLLLFE